MYGLRQRRQTASTTQTTPPLYLVPLPAGFQNGRTRQSTRRRSSGVAFVTQLTVFVGCAVPKLKLKSSLLQPPVSFVIPTAPVYVKQRVAFATQLGHSFLLLWSWSNAKFLSFSCSYTWFVRNGPHGSSNVLPTKPTSREENEDQGGKTNEGTAVGRHSDARKVMPESNLRRRRRDRRREQK